jgi:hypothetical protein
MVLITDSVSLKIRRKSSEIFLRNNLSKFHSNCKFQILRLFIVQIKLDCNIVTGFSFFLELRKVLDGLLHNSQNVFTSLLRTSKSFVDIIKTFRLQKHKKQKLFSSIFGEWGAAAKVLTSQLRKGVLK